MDTTLEVRRATALAAWPGSWVRDEEAKFDDVAESTAELDRLWIKSRALPTVRSPNSRHDPDRPIRAADVNPGQVAQPTATSREDHKPGTQCHSAYGLPRRAGVMQGSSPARESAVAQGCPVEEMTLPLSL